MKIAGIIIVTLIGVVVVLFFVLGRKSQNGQAPGLIDGHLAPCSSKPNCVSSEDSTADTHKVDAFSKDVWRNLQAAITAQGGVITQENDTYIAAEFTSNLYKFVDDFEARLDGETVHVRLSSRVGYSDGGVNRKRVEAMRARFTQD